MTTETDPQIELVVPTADGERLLIRSWTAPNGRQLVTCAPQYVGRDGSWKLRHSGLALRPEHARELAPLLLEMADHVDGDGR
jgi:hypothetical protein